MIVFVLILMAIMGCSTAPKRAESRAVLASEAREATVVFKEKAPSIQSFFDNSYGYAVLPKVFKGGFWIGGAYGKGEVYE